MTSKSSFLWGCAVGVVLTVVGLSGTALATVAGLAWLGKSLATTFTEVGIQGRYECPKCLYTAVEFRPGGHAVIEGLGLAFPTSYEVSADRIYVKTDKANIDLGFQLMPDGTLEGEGFSAGTYHRAGGR